MSSQSGETNCNAEHCITRQERNGLIVVTTSGFLSLVAVLYIFSRLLYHAIHTNHKLIRKPMDLYTLSLFTGGLIQALSVVLEVKWINDGEVHGGSFCRTQGGAIFSNL